MQADTKPVSSEGLTMQAAVRRYAQTRPVRAALLSLVFAAVLAFACLRAVDLTRWWLFTRQLNAIERAGESGPPLEVTWRFSYRGGLVPVTVRVYPSDLSAGKALNTAWVFESPPSVRARYVRSLVQTQSRTRLVRELSSELHAIARRQRLDDDRFADLAAAAVQGIEYGSIGSEISLPAEMLAGGAGVCTEKSVLLAAVLLHEDYETAMLVLDASNHVAVGVGSDRIGYRTLPYAFIETTRFAPIGVTSRDDLAWGPVGKPPQAIELGGAKRYGGQDEQASSAVPEAVRE